jgi:2-polyprenyl-3-methyl-5-hydroxy-6-metoxy-1,4-benzoquinol methylase
MPASKNLVTFLQRIGRSRRLQGETVNDSTYKFRQRKFYDSLSKSHLLPQYDWRSGPAVMLPGIRSPYLYLEEWLSPRCAGKRLLDYGCGEGIFSVHPAKRGAMVVGVDISSGALAVACKRADLEGVRSRISFCAGDCEALAFPDSTFDIIMSCGTLPSLTLKRAVPELARVLKPDGHAIIVDTLGHNPLLNIRRAFSVRKGRITKWEKDHILKLSDLELFRQHFGNMQSCFFDLSSLGVALIARDNGSLHGLVRHSVNIDSKLLGWPFLRKYAFKVVLILSGPKKA